MLLYNVAEVCAMYIERSVRVFVEERRLSTLERKFRKVGMLECTDLIKKPQGVCSALDEEMPRVDPRH